MNKSLGFKNNRKATQAPKGKQNKHKLLPVEPDFELSFMVLDLTGKTTADKIIRINQILVDKEGNTNYSEHLFSNGDTPINEEAASYHGITQEMLLNKPELSVDSFNFKQAKNIVVWDGKVTQTLFKRNNINEYSPIINLQALARYLEVEPKPIRLIDYAVKCLAHKKFQVELMLRKPNNKIKVLPEIFDSLKRSYKDLYGEDKVSFLVTVGKANNKKTALASINSYLEKKEVLRKQREEYLKKHPSKNETKTDISDDGRKVIKVVINHNSTNNKNKGKSNPYSTNVVVRKKS